MEKKRITAIILADSTNKGHRLITYLLTYPRFIHAELMTHRVFSRNSASSRAIPFEKMIKSVEEDPFIPIAWQKDHKGMQGVEYFTETEEINKLTESWISASKTAVLMAKVLSGQGLTKQLCNRILEPYLWHTVIVTASEWDNFFELRCPRYKFPALKDQVFKSKKEVLTKTHFANSLSDIDWLKASQSGAEIHIQALAEAMWDAKNESTPKELKPGEWHIPFGDQMNNTILFNYADSELNFAGGAPEKYVKKIMELKVAVAVARCARLSYMTFEGKIDYTKDIELHDILLKSKHLSPFEHCAKAMTDVEYNSFIHGVYIDETDDEVVEYFEKHYDLYINWNFPNHMGIVPGWCNNFRGFIPYRYLVENV